MRVDTGCEIAADASPLQDLLHSAFCNPNSAITLNDVLKITTRERLPELAATYGPMVLDPEVFDRHAPDVHLMLMQDARHCTARCSLWWSDVPVYGEERLGLIGHYAATNGAAGQALLDFACMELDWHDVTLAVGPMDGSTWRSYRFVTEWGEAPPFFLEPHHPPDWPDHWSETGFTPLSTYFSTHSTDLTHTDPRIPTLTDQLADAGLRIRQLDPERDLHYLYHISTTSFADNFLYSPISESEFELMYRPLLPHVRPELIRIAERGDEPVGFVFGVPDLAQAQRGESVDTMIVKTVAVVPEMRSSGLGSVLVAMCHEAGRALGFRRVIHALMHETNVSRKISAHYAEPMRRYALFARSIAS